MTAQAATKKQKPPAPMTAGQLNKLIDQLLVRRAELKAMGMPTFEIEQQLTSLGEAWVRKQPKAL